MQILVIYDLNGGRVGTAKLTKINRSNSSSSNTSFHTTRTSPETDQITQIDDLNNLLLWNRSYDHELKNELRFSISC